MAEGPGFYIRFPLAEADRKTFMYNEVEPGAQIDLTSKPDAPYGEVRGFYGPITEIPADPTRPGKRYDSIPFRVRLDLEAVRAIGAEILRCARAQGVAGLTPTTIVLGL